MADLRAFATQTAQKYGLPPSLFVQQIQQESGFQPGVTSPAGAQGIAQLMPATAASVGLTNPFDPVASIDAMGRLMSQYVNQYGSYQNALVAYNAGPGAVGKPLPRETQQYVANITGGGSVPPAQSGTDPSAVIDAMLQSLLQNQPNIGDYHDIMDSSGKYIDQTAQEQYQAALDSWHTQVTTALDLKKSFSSTASGMYTLPDGTHITQAQIDQMQQSDPAAYAQIQAAIANQNTDQNNKYNQLMNDLGLTEFTTGQHSAQAENDRTSTDFQNQLASYREKLSLDEANQNTGLNKIDRQLKGMSEARSRAQTALDALQAAAPWGTSNGKTSFSAADLGAGVAGLAGKGNLDPNAPLMNFPGMQTVDPNSMFNFYDSQLGVSGALPQVPDLTTTPGMIPQAPNSIPIQQGAPSFTPYSPYQSIPIPQASPPPPVSMAGALQSQMPMPQLQTQAPLQPPVQRPFVPMAPLITPLTTMVTNQYLR